MRLLLDTHVLIWALNPRYPGAERLSDANRDLIADGENDVLASVVSVWEVAVKFALGRGGFDLDPAILRSAMAATTFEELAITGDHALAVRDLPPIHKDPFDRMLLAQARVEGLTLLTADATIVRYPGLVRLI